MNSLLPSLHTLKSLRQKEYHILPLKQDVMPAPITTDEEVWDQYTEMYCKGMDDEHVGYWKEFFASCMQPIPYGNINRIKSA